MDTDGNEVGIIPQQLREHYDMAFKCEQKISQPMTEEEAQISINDVKTQLKKIKHRKAPGPDGIKAELFKVLVDSNKCTEELTLCLNNILTEDDTVLIPKTKRPTVKDLRPIALTNASYKIFTGILKTKIEEHIKITQGRSDLQASYTENRRISNNLYILRYCIEESFKSKQPLIVLLVDFKKSFDSVD